MKKRTCELKILIKINFRNNENIVFDKRVQKNLENTFKIKSKISFDDKHTSQTISQYTSILVPSYQLRVVIFYQLVQNF